MVCSRLAGGVLTLLLLAGCAQSGSGTATPAPMAPALPADADALVLQVAATGGYTTPALLAGRLPIVSIYADGRVITQGPVPAIYPAPAWPNVQVRRVGPAAVAELVEQAVAAGITDDGDLGRPAIADATSTRFTLVTARSTYVREAYALTEGLGMPAEALSEQQRVDREQLADLVRRLSDPQTTLGAEQVSGPEPYALTAVAGVVTPWMATDSPGGMTEPSPETWPGPILPGEPLPEAPLPVSCVTAMGAKAEAVRTAAVEATDLTPWLDAEGTRWSILLRPLLPDEAGCADLTN